MKLLVNFVVKIGKNDLNGEISCQGYSFLFWVYRSSFCNINKDDYRSEAGPNIDQLLDVEKIRLDNNQVTVNTNKLGVIFIRVGYLNCDASADATADATADNHLRR